MLWVVAQSGRMHKYKVFFVFRTETQPERDGKYTFGSSFLICGEMMSSWTHPGCEGRGEKEADEVEEDASKKE